MSQPTNNKPNVGNKLFFIVLFLIWLAAIAIQIITLEVNDIWGAFFVFSIEGLIIIGIPYLFLIFIRHIGKNYPEDSFLNKILAFEGKFNRLDYFIYTLVIESLIFGAIVAAIFFPALIFLPTAIFSPALLESTTIRILSFIIIIITQVIALSIVLILLYSLILITLKRISDIGKSRWLGIMFLVPFVNLLFQIVLYFIPSAQKNEMETIKRSYKTCPECAESILQEAIKCRYCGYRFE